MSTRTCFEKEAKSNSGNDVLVGFVIRNKSHVLFQSRNLNSSQVFDNFLLFQMIKDMKQQFSSLLRDIGFLDSSDPKATSANHNSGADLNSPSS